MGFFDRFSSKDRDPNAQLEKLELCYRKTESEMERYQVEMARAQEAVYKIDKELGDCLKKIEKEVRSSGGAYEDDDAKAILSQMVALQEEETDIKMELNEVKASYNELRPVHRMLKNNISALERTIYDAKTFGTKINPYTINTIIETIQETENVLGKKSRLDSHNLRRFMERQRETRKDTKNAEMARIKETVDIDRVLSEIQSDPGKYNPSIVKAYEIVEKSQNAKKDSPEHQPGPIEEKYNFQK